jgi:hypothetical protein
MTSVPEIVESLKGILRSSGSEREELMDRVHNAVMRDQDLVLDTESEDILVDLVVTMDYYEPNPEWRRHDPSYYDDTKLVEVLNSAIERLEKYLRNSENKPPDSATTDSPESAH